MASSSTAAQTALPSLSKQKAFIAENAGILNRETKIAILRIVMQEIEGKAVMENSGTKEVDINLDICAEANEEVIHHIYNMVRARLDSLNQPAGRNVGQQRGRAEAENAQQTPLSAGTGQDEVAKNVAATPTQAPKSATTVKAVAVATAITGKTTAASVAARRKEFTKK
jgi:hypothetical protein